MSCKTNHPILLRACAAFGAGTILALPLLPPAVFHFFPTARKRVAAPAHACEEWFKEKLKVGALSSALFGGSTLVLSWCALELGRDGWKDWRLGGAHRFGSDYGTSCCLRIRRSASLTSTLLATASFGMAALTTGSICAVSLYLWHQEARRAPASSRNQK